VEIRDIILELRKTDFDLTKRIETLEFFTSLVLAEVRRIFREELHGALLRIKDVSRETTTEGDGNGSSSEDGGTPDSTTPEKRVGKVSKRGGANVRRSRKLDDTVTPDHV
jgi:hypothetical protein